MRQLATDCDSHLPLQTSIGTLYPDSACYDTVRGEMLLFGFAQDPLWSYGRDGLEGQERRRFRAWISVGYTAMAFDTNRGVAVLPAPTPGAYGLTMWEWDGAAWQQPLNPAATPHLYFGCRSDLRPVPRRNASFREVIGTVDGQPNDRPLPAPGLLSLWSGRWNGKQWQADPPTPTAGVPIELYNRCASTAPATR